MNPIIVLYTVMFFFGIYFLLLFILLHVRHREELYDYPKPAEFPFISFITPAYNEEKSVARTLRSILNIDYPQAKKEIIVVDDGSTDKTEGIVRELMKKYKGIKLLNKKNSGKADSLNRAIKIARGEFIAVVDSDSHPVKNSVKKMIGYFEDEQVAAVTSKVWIKNRKNFIERYQDIDYVVIAWGRKILDFIGCVYVTNGPLSIYRKKLVQKVGGFDPKNMTEDIELTWNLLSKGYKTKMSYSAKAYTFVPDNFKEWVGQRVRWNVGGMQTIWKYRNHVLKGENLFGYFVITYVAVSFVLSILGFILLMRLFYMKLVPALLAIPYFILGSNPFASAEFSFPVTILLILGLTFLTFSLIYHKLAIKDSDLKNKSILTILIYTFVYRSLYIIPLALAIFKLARRDIGWYTK